MMRISVLVLFGLLLAGCASTDVPAPIYDRSPKTGAAPIEDRSPKSKASAPAPATPQAQTGAPSGASRPDAPARNAGPAPPTVPAAKPTPPPPSAATSKSAASASPSPVPTVPSTPLPPPAAVSGAAVASPASPSTRPAADVPAIRPYREGDWRPEYYTVKRGDTLYSIALDYGQDYRDLAAWNNLADPAYIQVDQRIRLFAPGSGGEATSPEPVALPPATIPAGKPAETTPVAIPLLAEPKARRAAYSDQILAELIQHGNSMQKRGPSSAATAPAGPPTAAVPAKPAVPPKSVQVGFSGLPDERLTWQWPTSGTVTYAFGEGANYKGIGINGVLGQAVFAAAPGKVVYSGSGLRGYGKLIIIKHNATYLSVYAHNSQLLVKEGQTVAQGQKIAEIGDSDSDRVGLHFEIRRLGKPIDPQKYLPEKAS